MNFHDRSFVLGAKPRPSDPNPMPVIWVFSAWMLCSVWLVDSSACHTRVSRVPCDERTAAVRCARTHVCMYDTRYWYYVRCTCTYIVRSIINNNRVFCGEFGWVRFLAVCFSYKTNPNPRKTICCGKKVAQMPLWAYFFLGLGWPWVGEFDGFIIIIIYVSQPNRIWYIANTLIPRFKMIPG